MLLAGCAAQCALAILLACPPIDQEDPMKPGGVIPGTCDPGTKNCTQGPQCQPRADNPFMPIFHILG